MVRTLRIFLVVLLSGYLPGCCATFKPGPLSFSEHLYIPPINVQNETAVGDALMTRIDGKGIISFVAIQDYQPEDMPSVNNLLYHYDPILRGSEWTIIGVLESGDYLCNNDNYSKGTAGNVTLVINANGEASGIADYLGNCASVNKWKTKPESPIFRGSKTYLPGSFKQELLYNGKSSNTIKISYREFRNDFARPNFYQDLSYDLADSKIVGFRGMKIEVIEATNSYIRYIIKSPMKD